MREALPAHDGIDIRAPRGEPVRAAGDGMVLEATDRYNNNDAWGKVVVIDHGLSVVLAAAEAADPTAAVAVAATTGLVVVAVTDDVSQYLNQHHLHNHHPLHNQHLPLHNHLCPLYDQHPLHQLVQCYLLMVTHNLISVLMVMVYMIVISLVLRLENSSMRVGLMGK